MVIARRDGRGLIGRREPRRRGSPSMGAVACAPSRRAPQCCLPTTPRPTAVCTRSLPGEPPCRGSAPRSSLSARYAHTTRASARSPAPTPLAATAATAAAWPLSSGDARSKRLPRPASRGLFPIRSSAMARRDLTRDQVKKAERPAWARAAADGPEEYYYDGIYFWHVPPRSALQAVREDQTPHAPWRHRSACNCPLCVGSPTISRRGARDTDPRPGGPRSGWLAQT